MRVQYNIERKKSFGVLRTADHNFFLGKETRPYFIWLHFQPRYPFFMLQVKKWGVLVRYLSTNSLIFALGLPLFVLLDYTGKGPPKIAYFLLTISCGSIPDCGFVTRTFCDFYVVCSYV